MKRIILLSLLTVLVGCATPTIPKSINYGSSQPLKTKLYEDSEVIFKDEHTPGSCRSPFR